MKSNLDQYKEIIPSGDASNSGRLQPFSFSITNDLAFDLKLYWIDYQNKAKLYRNMRNGDSSTHVSSYSGHVWVILNVEKQKCIVFKLGEAGPFEKPFSTVIVSNIKGFDCDPNEQIN